MENFDKYWLAFSSIEKIGSVFIKTLYEHFGTIKSAWCSGIDDLYAIESLTRKQITSFIEERKKINPEECLEYIINKKIKYINYTDKNYPELLKHIPNPPMTLFYKGDLNNCNLKRTLSVVGSRKASESAKTILNKIISEFRGTDICIVSGLALGIDTCAHKSAIENNLSTIGVIASGFDFTYPSSNKNLYKEIENGSGVIFSEYWPSFPPINWRFPHRNRIVTGLSKGTLVAEAALKSGALISANFCLEQNRELMCIPGNISNPNTEGIYKLIKNGAAVITNAKDILNALDWEIITTENQKKNNTVPLSENEQIIFNLIALDPQTADELAIKSGLDFTELTILLTEMELNGYIKQTDGEKFISILN